MKRERILYGCWLTVFAVLVVAYCLWPGRLPYWGASRTMGLLAFAMIDLLYVLQFLIGPNKKRNPAALRRLLCFAAATALYIYYCFGGKITLRSNTYRDAIVAGTLLCAAMLLGRDMEKEIDTPMD